MGFESIFHIYKMPHTIKSETVSFPVDEGKMDAYLTRPDTKEARPALVVIHEIWGLSQHIKDVADRFAKEGYVALAPDLFSPNQELKELFIPENIAAMNSFLQTIPAEKRRDTNFLQQEMAKLPEEIGRASCRERV